MKKPSTARGSTHLYTHLLLGCLAAIATPLDPNFGEGGIASQTIGSHGDSPGKIALHADGRIVMCGSTLNYSSSGSYGFDVGLARFNPNGTPDLSFGVDGKLFTDINSSYPVFTDDRGSALVIQPDNRIIVAGTTRQYTKSGQNQFQWYHWDVLLLRYLEDGTLDNSFGNAGKVIVDLRGTGSTPEGLNDVALQSDNKIIGVGYIYPGNNRFLIMRFLTDGTLDTSFGAAATGAVEEHFSVNTLEDAYDVMILPDDSIIAAGRGVKPDGDNTLSLLKLTPEGRLDSSFSGDGKVTMSLGVRTQAWGLATDASGRILVSGLDRATSSSDDHGLIVRFNSDGTLDSTFNGSGIFTVAMAEGTNLRLNDLAIEADGSIIAVGNTSKSSPDSIARVRLNEDGTLDAGFGSNGIATTTLQGGNYHYVRSCALQPDGKLLLGVHYYAPVGNPYTVVRYTTGTTGIRPDGIPIDWITAHFGGNEGAPSEVNKDGKMVSLLDAYLLGEDPLDPNDCIKIEPIMLADDSISIDFPTLVGRAYQVESSPDMIPDSWKPFGERIIGDATLTSIPLPKDSRQMFFRVVISIP